MTTPPQRGRDRTEFVIYAVKTEDRFRLLGISPGLDGGVPTDFLTVRFVGFHPFADTLDLAFDERVLYDVALERDDLDQADARALIERAVTLAKAAPVPGDRTRLEQAFSA